MKNLNKYLFCLLLIMNCSCKNTTDSRIGGVEEGLMKAFSFSEIPPEEYPLLERMKYYHVPGVSVAVIDDGKMEWAKGYGITEAGTDNKVSTETLFQIGSIGKMIAALTTLSLVNKGLLNLDEDIRVYLKSWKIPENEYTRGTKITLRQLLSHTAGVSDDYSGPFHLGSPLPSLTEHLKNNQYDIIKEPGEGYFYTGAGYIIIEQIIEDITGKAYKHVAEEEVIKPLRLENTFLQIVLPDSLMDRAAFAHHRDGTLYEDKYPVYPCYAPGTCNWSTAEDLAKLFIELQKSYYGKSNKVLPQSLARMMMTNLSPAYGLGIKSIPDKGATFIGHSGDFYGFHACVYGYLENGKGIVILTNGDNGVLLYNEIIRSVAKTYGWPGCHQEIVSKSTTDADHLKKLCGCYLLPGKLDVVNIYIKDMKLYCDVLGYKENELQQITPFKFYDKKTDAFILFNTDSNGDVQNVEFRRIGVFLPGTLLPGFDLLYTERFVEGKDIILSSGEAYARKKYFEYVFNSIGYVLLNEKKFRNAINVFDLAIAIYPEASNLYDSLGEAYMENGQKDLAVMNYKKSLELNPKNDNARNMLKQLGMQ